MSRDYGPISMPWRRQRPSMALWLAGLVIAVLAFVGTPALVHPASISSLAPTRDYRKIPGSVGRMDDPATAYYGRRGGYVVRNERTGDVVQVSDRLNPHWKAPWDR